MSDSAIRRFSSRRSKLHETFLGDVLKRARAYDRIAGFFSSSILEIAGEGITAVQGPIRVVCNSGLHPRDVKTARAARLAVRRAWTSDRPERHLDEGDSAELQGRFKHLFDLLVSEKLRVRVLPNDAFGLLHGKAGVVTLADGSRTCFVGSANETAPAWMNNYEIVWEDKSPEAVAWVQEEFDALWASPQATPLSEAVVDDIGRLSNRKVLHSIHGWEETLGQDTWKGAAAAVIESPVYRQEVGLWDHQKYFAKLAFDQHRGPMKKARLVLADQVGLGKTLQLAMTAQLIALTGEKPVLVLCPKTLIWQWQAEMRDLLNMPSAVWDRKQWWDENGIEHPVDGPSGILRCPRKVGIVSTSIITHRSEPSRYLLSRDYDCVILDEAHRARRKNLGEGEDDQAPDPNNLMRFMHELGPRARSLLLATATPVQLRPVEAWDLLDILGRGDESVIGNGYSLWRDVEVTFELITGRAGIPEEETTQWQWLRNPLPAKNEGIAFETLRRELGLPETVAVAPVDGFDRLRPPVRASFKHWVPDLFQAHNPFLRRIVRRTREQLEKQIDPETGEPLLQRIDVVLHGEDEVEAIQLPLYLREAYGLAEEFCQILGTRMKGSGFLKTLLLRRVGSTAYAGHKTAERLLSEWTDIELEEEDELDEALAVPPAPWPEDQDGRVLAPAERELLERFVAALEANESRDPKYEVVLMCLRDWVWLEKGCIIFSQYRDSIKWLAESLTQEFPSEPIAVYTAPSKSGIMQGGSWRREDRENLKKMVNGGRVRLMLGTDAASEGLNLQKLGTLINLDLPWNPTRLEQRKGRIQRIGQIYDTVEIYNMRYKGSVEDRVHDLLSQRLQNIHALFGQVPDILEDAWIHVALNEIEQAEKVIDAVPDKHPFELKYTRVEKVDWESCELVLDEYEKRKVLSQGW